MYDQYKFMTVFGDFGQITHNSQFLPEFSDLKAENYFF